MICPNCKEDTTIIFAADNYYNARHKDYKRYRKCSKCGYHFVTHEYYIQNNYQLKKDIARMTDEEKAIYCDDYCKYRDAVFSGIKDCDEAEMYLYSHFCHNCSLYK